MAKKNFDYLYKILLIGDSSVGKTSLVCRFCDESFSTSFVTTIGIDFKIKTIEINNKKIKLQIWDTAGHERFHSLTTSYYRGAHGVMMVYSIADSKTFGNISGWLRSLATHADSDVIKMLIGNKCDLEMDRAISQLDGEQMAANYGIKFFETSAKLNINVDTVFFEMAGMIHALMPAQPEVPKDNFQVEYYDHEDEGKKRSCCFQK